MSNAQSPAPTFGVIDSMKQIIRANQKLKVGSDLLAKNYYDLAGYYRISNPDSALRYYEMVLSYAEKKHNDTLVGNIQERLGNLYLQKGMAYTALEYFLRNYRIYDKMGIAKSKAYALCDIGNVYYAYSMFEIALKYYTMSLNTFQSIQDKPGQAVIYNNFGLVNLALQKYDSAIYYFQLSLRLRRQLGNQFDILHTKAYIARAYLEKGNPEEALRFLDEILFVLSNISLPYEEEKEYKIAFLLLRGKAWMDLKQIETARENYLSALKIAEDAKAEYSMAEIYLSLAILSNAENKSEQANEFAHKALKLASKTKNFSVYRNSFYFLARLHERMNHPQLSSEYYKKSFLYTDSLLKETTKRKLEDVARAIELYELQVQAEKAKERHKQQRILWIIIVGILISLLSGIAVYLRVMARLRKEFENIANSSFEGLIIHNNGKIILLNRKAEQMFGFKKNEMIGKSVYDFIVPEYTEYVKDLVNSDKEANYHAQIRHKNGSSTDVEVLSKPIMFKGQTFRVAAIRDITQVQRLVRDNRILSTAVEQMHEMLIITDKEANIIYTNSAFEKITGYGRQEVIYKNPCLLKSGTYSKEFYEDMWKTLIAGKIWSGEFLNKKKDGRLYWIKSIITPVKDEQGVTMYYASVSEDITVQKEAAEELRRKDLLYRQLASNLPGSAVFLINKDWEFVLAEGQALIDLGLSSSDFEKKNVESIITADFVDNELGSWHDLLHRVFEGQTISYQTRFGKLDFQITLMPLTDFNGHYRLVLMLMQDITQALHK